MDDKKAPGKPNESTREAIKRRLREKYPQLIQEGVPYFSRFEIVRMDDEEFEFFATAGVQIMVNKRTLNYVNDRCKELGIRKELGDGILHVKKRSGSEPL